MLRCLFDHPSDKKDVTPQVILLYISFLPFLFLPLPIFPFLSPLLSSPSPFSLFLFFFSSLILSSFSSILPLLLFSSIYYIPHFFTFFPPLSLLRLPSSLSFILPTHPPVPLSLPFRTPSLSSISSSSSPLPPYYPTTPADRIFFHNLNRHHKDPIRSDQTRSDPIRSNLAYPPPRLCLRETDVLRQIDGERCCYVT